MTPHTHWQVVDTLDDTLSTQLSSTKTTVLATTFDACSSPLRLVERVGGSLVSRMLDYPVLDELFARMWFAIAASSERTVLDRVVWGWLGMHVRRGRNAGLHSQIARMSNNAGSWSMEEGSTQPAHTLNARTPRVGCNFLRLHFTSLSRALGTYAYNCGSVQKYARVARIAARRE